jgi:transcription antitermination protein NusB
MKSLRKAREVALQILFQQEFAESKQAEDLLQSFIDNFNFEPETITYARTLTESVLYHEQELNQIISQFSNNWRLDRMALIDRIILQLATYELRLIPDPPTAPKLCLTDYIDLAKKYSSQESKNFINGVLDQIYQQEISS